MPNEMPGFLRLLVVTSVAIAMVGCSRRDVAVDVGVPAPEITLVGANREGVLPDPLRLQDFRGQTVVLAFFFKARTPG